MNEHQTFLQFNGQNIIFLSVEGEHWIALKPILDALNLAAVRYLKKVKRDAFLGGCLDTMSMQVGEKGKKQGRKMTCLPEKYIYGWILTLNGNDPELLKYKQTCYDLIYNHFHGTITKRKTLLDNRRKEKKIVEEIENEIHSHPRYQELIDRKKTIKKQNKQLKNIDNEMIQISLPFKQ